MQAALAFLFFSLCASSVYLTNDLLDLPDDRHHATKRGRPFVAGRFSLWHGTVLGAAAGYLSVMVLALYIRDPGTMVLYRYPEVIWLACPLLLFWITRVWLVTHRREMHDDPVVFALCDRASLVVGLLFCAAFWIVI